MWLSSNTFSHELMILLRARLGSLYTETLGAIYEGNVALIMTMLRLSKYRDATTARARDQYVFNVIMAYLVYSEIEKDNLGGLA